MANTAITLTNEQGAFVPSQPSVLVHAGDTISFSTSDGSAAYLFFSPDASEVLSPAPSGAIQVSSDAFKFEFTSSSPGAYSVYFGASANDAVPAFPAIPSNQLLLEIDLSELKFGVVNDRTRGE